MSGGGFFNTLAQATAGIATGGLYTAGSALFNSANNSNNLPAPPPPPQIEAGGEVQTAELEQEENKQGQASTNLQGSHEPASTMAPTYSAGRTILGGR